MSAVRDMADAALVECRLPVPKAGKYAMVDQLAVVAKIKTSEAARLLVATHWQLLLWPVSRLISDDAKPSHHLTPSGQLPDRIPGLPHGGVEQLAALADVSVETAWNNGVIDGSDERRLISVWLCRHTKDQLHKLRSELNVTEGSSTMGREELAGCVLNAHRPGRPLPLPKRLNK